MFFSVSYDKCDLFVLYGSFGSVFQHLSHFITDEFQQYTYCNTRGDIQFDGNTKSSNLSPVFEQPMTDLLLPSPQPAREPLPPKVGFRPQRRQGEVLQ